jgi:hypothetical protein
LARENVLNGEQIEAIFHSTDESAIESLRKQLVRLRR